VLLLLSPPDLEGLLAHPSLLPPCCLACFACRRVAWCHGAAGFVLTLLKAAEVLGDNDGGRYMTAATAAGNDIWQRGLLKKVTYR
jgi:hypothetical protein